MCDYLLDACSDLVFIVCFVLVVFFFFFFFQAEDGIRDLYVTGVQTCALPISEPAVGRHELVPRELRNDPSDEGHSGDGEIRRGSHVDLVRCAHRERERNADHAYASRIAPSSCASSRQLWYRCLGSLASSRTMIASSSAGTCGFFSRGGTGRLFTCIIRIGTSSSWKNGTCPVNIS